MLILTFVASRVACLQLVVNSRSVNEGLPESIAAFFVLKGSEHYVTDLGYGAKIDARQAQRDFKLAFGRSDAQTPLLVFDPWNWEEPFREAALDDG